MTACESIFYLINLELDGEITAEEQRQLDDHRATCPHCAALSEELHQMQEAIRNLDELEPPEGFKDRVLEKIRQEKPSNVVPFRRHVRRYGSLAACALLCVGLLQLGLFLGENAESDSRPEMAVMTTTATTTASASPSDVSGPMETALEDDQTAIIAQAETATTMTTEMDGRVVQTMDEQVAELLGEPQIAWIIIATDELTDSLPEGVGDMVVTETFAYALVEPERWTEVRQAFGFGEGEPMEEGIPCVLIVRDD